MEQLLKVQMLYNTLNEQETGEFHRNFIASFGMDQILNMIFKMFATCLKLHQACNTQQLQAIQDMLNNIVWQRKHTHYARVHDASIKMSAEPKNHTICDLAQTTISHVASFLKFSDVLAFQRCSRAILIGIRSLPLQIISGHDLRKFLLFSSTQHSMTVSPSYFDRFRLRQSVGICVPNLCRPMNRPYRHDDRHWEMEEKDVTPVIELSRVPSWSDTTCLCLELNTNQYEKLSAYLLTEMAKCDLSNVTRFGFSDEHKKGYVTREGTNIEALLNLVSKMSSLEFFLFESCLETLQQYQALGASLARLHHFVKLSVIEPRPCSFLQHYNSLLRQVCHKLEELVIECSRIYTLRGCNFTNLWRLSLENAPVQMLDVLVNETDWPVLEQIELRWDNVETDQLDNWKRSMQMVLGLPKVRTFIVFSEQPLSSTASHARQRAALDVLLDILPYACNSEISIKLKHDANEKGWLLDFREKLNALSTIATALQLKSMPILLQLGIFDPASIDSEILQNFINSQSSLDIGHDSEWAECIYIESGTSNVNTTNTAGSTDE